MAPIAGLLGKAKRMRRALLRAAVVAACFGAFGTGLAAEPDPALEAAAAARNRVAIEMANAGDWAGAAFAAEMALEANRAALGPDHPAVADSLFNLAMIFRNSGRSEQVRALHDEALQIRRRRAEHDPEAGPALADSLSAVGAMDLADGRTVLAKSRIQEALDLRLAGDGDPLAMADTMLLLSRAYRAEADYAAALGLTEDLVLIVERRLGPDHPAVAEGLAELAAIHAERGAPDQAAPLMLRVLYIHQSNFGKASVPVGHSYARLGALHDQDTDFARAAKFYTDGAEALAEALGPQAPAVIELTAHAAASHARAGDIEAALVAQRAMLDGAGDGPVSQATLDALGVLAETLKAAGRREAQAVKAAIARLSPRSQ